MSVLAGKPFQFYIQNPDGSLTLHEGQPPAGYVATSQHQQPVVQYQQQAVQYQQPTVQHQQPAAQYQQLPMPTSTVANGGYSYSQLPQAASGQVATPMPTLLPAAPVSGITVAAVPKKRQRQDWGTGAAGQRLGGGHAGDSEVEKRQMVLQAAEQRQNAMVGVSKERASELARQRQRDDLLR